MYFILENKSALYFDKISAFGSATFLHMRRFLTVCRSKVKPSQPASRAFLLCDDFILKTRKNERATFTVEHSEARDVPCSCRCLLFSGCCCCRSKVTVRFTWMFDFRFHVCVCETVLKAAAQTEFWAGSGSAGQNRFWLHIFNPTFDPEFSGEKTQQQFWAQINFIF